MAGRRPIVVVLSLWLLGCSGVLGSGGATGETGDTGEAPADDEEDDEDDGVADGETGDTGGTEEKPRDDERGGRRGRREREKPKPKPKPKPKARTMCFGGGGLDLQLEVDGSRARGSLVLSGKAEVAVPKLAGSRSGNRINVSGNGTVNGKKKAVKVQAGKEGGKAVVTIEGRDVKGAKVVPCP